MSLLDKAKELRETDAVQAETEQTQSGFVFDKDSGISEEDQKDILVQIEQVAQQSRITASPEILRTGKAKKKGYALPFFVNAGALLVLGGGLLLLSFLFKQSESELRGEAALVRSAEGKLIQEIKKETEAQLKAKENEISSIQTRLSEIDKERSELQSNMDAKVKLKEDELRKNLERELAEERRKLNAQGLSEAAINERLKRFEDERNAAFNAQLANIRKDAEAEKARLESNLQKLQNDFQKNLASLNSERQQIVDESRKREESLRAQLEERTKSLETERSKAQEQLTKAEAELKKAGELKEKVNLIENQINGFFSTTKTSLAGGNYEAARTSLTSLKTYLSDEAIASLPGIQRQRETNLVAADALSSLIEDSIRRQKEVSTISEMLKTEATVEDIKKTVALANEALKAGNIAEAEKQFNAALSRVPDVLTSHQYFLNKKIQEEQAKKKALEDTVKKAETAFKAGNHQDAVAAYTQALAYLPADAAIGPSFIQNVQKSGYEILTEEQRQLQSANAPGLVAEGDKAFSEARYEQAVAAYITALQKYPLSRQSPAAMEGIRKVVRSQVQVIESSGSAANSTITSLQAEKNSLEATIKNLKEAHAAEINRLTEEARQASLMKAENQEQAAYVNSLKTRISDLETEIQNLKRNQAEKDGAIAGFTLQSQEETRRISAMEAEYNRLKVTHQQTVDEYNKLKATHEQSVAEYNRLQQTHKETLGEVKRLTAVENDYTNLKKTYVDYAAREDGTFAAKGSSSIVETKLYLDAFLVSERMRSDFPGFSDRIKKYDKAFQETGRNQALMEATDIVYRIAAARTKTEADAILAEETEKRKSNPEMLEFIKTLKKVKR